MKINKFGIFIEILTTSPFYVIAIAYKGNKFKITITYMHMCIFITFMGGGKGMWGGPPSQLYFYCRHKIICYRVTLNSGCRNRFKLAKETSNFKCIYRPTYFILQKFVSQLQKIGIWLSEYRCTWITYHLKHAYHLKLVSNSRRYSVAAAAPAPATRSLIVHEPHSLCRRHAQRLM